MKKGDIVEIIWADTTYDARWVPLPKAEKYPLTICVNIGYFLDKDNRAVRLSDSLNTDKEGSVTAIPLGCVLRMYKLKRPVNRQKSIKVIFDKIFGKGEK